MKEEFSFCESMYAGPMSPWHIRQLTDVGRKLGGGADTPALCGRVVAWDLMPEITDKRLHHACEKCVEEYRTVAATA